MDYQKENQFSKYIIFWLSQSVSQLGSSMTGFALILWVYTVNHSALTVSLMTFCNYVPYILVSLFAGAFVDRHHKKSIMLLADSAAAIGTLAVCVLVMAGSLRLWHIYLVNILIGSMNAFQSPASTVAVGKLVPKAAVWCIAGIAASLPIPFINAGQNVIMYRSVPEQMQGRIFAVRNALQYSTIPLGILLGGYLADYVESKKTPV